MLIFSLLLSFLVEFNNVTNSIAIMLLLLLFVIWILISNRFEKNVKSAAISSERPIDLGKRKFLFFSAIVFATLLIGTSLPQFDILSPNLLYNGDFIHGTDGWHLPPGVFTWRISPDIRYNNLPVLEVQTDMPYTNQLLWSWIISDLIRVDYNSRYRIKTHVMGSNVIQASVVVQPYDENKKDANYQLVQVPSGQNGDFPFTEYGATVDIPYGVHYIGLYLNAGLAKGSGRPGKTYFAGLSVTKISNLIS